MPRPEWNLRISNKEMREKERTLLAKSMSVPAFSPSNAQDSEIMVEAPTKRLVRVSQEEEPPRKITPSRSDFALNYSSPPAAHQRTRSPVTPPRYSAGRFNPFGVEYFEDANRGTSQFRSSSSQSYMRVFQVSNHYPRSPIAVTPRLERSLSSTSVSKPPTNYAFGAATRFEMDKGDVLEWRAVRTPDGKRCYLHGKTDRAEWKIPPNGKPVTRLKVPQVNQDGHSLQHGWRSFRTPNGLLCFLPPQSSQALWTCNEGKENIEWWGDAEQTVKPPHQEDESFAAAPLYYPLPKRKSGVNTSCDVDRSPLLARSTSVLSTSPRRRRSTPRDSFATPSALPPPVQPTTPSNAVTLVRSKVKSSTPRSPSRTRLTQKIDPRAKVEVQTAIQKFLQSVDM